MSIFDIFKKKPNCDSCKYKKQIEYQHQSYVKKKCIFVNGFLILDKRNKIIKEDAKNWFYPKFTNKRIEIFMKEPTLNKIVCLFNNGKFVR